MLQEGEMEQRHHDIDQTLHDDVLQESNNVVVNVGLVEEQFAMLWWALAQQTARVARRVEDAEMGETQSGQWNAAGAVPAPVTSWAVPSPTLIPERDWTSVAPPTLSNSSSNSSSVMSTSPTTPMSSPRLVREICRKYPAGTSYVGGMPVYQSYVYETPSTEVVAASGSGSNNNVQLLRYVRVSQSGSVEQLPPSLRGSFRRPKSDVMPRKFDVATQQNRELEASSSGDCVRYESQDLGRDDLIDELDSNRPSSASYSPIVVVVTSLVLDIITAVHVLFF